MQDPAEEMEMEPHLQPNTHEKLLSYAVTYTVISEQQSP